MTGEMAAWRRTLLAVALLGALLAAQAADARRQPATAVGVSAREYRFGVYRTSVPSGPVRFNLANYGEDAHDLAILDRSGRRLAASQEVRAGQRTTVTVRLSPGTYRLRCDVSDHARRGMRASLRVTRR